MGLGRLEAELLQWVADQTEGATAREAFVELAERHGLARTTVLTMLERLYEKGFLQKKKEEGVFRYRALKSRTDILRSQISNFVRDRLQGSWAPLVASFCEAEKLTQEERAVLQRLLARLDEGTGSEKK